MVLAALQPGTICAQEKLAPLVTTPAASPTSPDEVVDNPGADFTIPVNLFQLRYEYRTAPGSGALPGTITPVTTDTATLRVDHRIDLAPQWALGLRADLPFAAKDPINSYNPSGDYVYGLGDAFAQAALTNELDWRWRVGVGLRLYAPTGGDVLGAGKWRIMPGFAVRYALPELSPGSYFEPLWRYDQSFAGNPARSAISNLQFAPSLNIGLPDRWFFTLYPNADIRVNYGPPITGQTGRLFLPFDASIGRKLADNLTLTLEVGVPIIKDYPVYNFKSEIRLNFLF